MSIHTYTPSGRHREVPPLPDPKPAVGDEAQARRGWLNHGNPPGDFTNAPRCGAKTRRGTRCMVSAMKNGRCRMHGGCSTGPKTPEGLERSRKARWKHGRYSASARAERREARARLAWTGRFFDLLRIVDPLFLLLDSIASQIDGNEPHGLRVKCVSALKLWRVYRAVLNGAPETQRTPARSRTRTATLDRSVAVMLEAGASGDGPNEIRKKLAAILSCNGTVG
jgi:hypothetical protein